MKQEQIILIGILKKRNITIYITSEFDADLWLIDINVTQGIRVINNYMIIRPDLRERVKKWYADGYKGSVRNKFGKVNLFE